MKALILITLLATTQLSEKVRPDLPLWELTVISSRDMIDMPERYEVKMLCVNAGIEMLLEDDDLQGFICELERS